MNEQRNEELYVEESMKLNSRQKLLVSKIYELVFLTAGTGLGMYGCVAKNEMWFILGLMSLGGALGYEVMEYKSDLEPEKEKVKQNDNRKK